MSKFTEFTLPRTGQSSLAFTGELIAEAKSPAYRRHQNNPSSRAHWFEASVYRTKSGKFVLSVAYRWAGNLSREENMDFAWAFTDTQAVYDKMSIFEAADCVRGYPVGDYWENKQQSLLESIQEDFDTLSELITTKVEQVTQKPERVE